MKEAVLVLIKPDGISKSITGYVVSRLLHSDLEIIGAKVVKVSRTLAANHYSHLKGKSYYDEVLQYTLGAFHEKKYVIAFVFWGNNAIKKCRKLAGSTNPEDASSSSIRGSLGRITTKGVFENVLHVSCNLKESNREIKIWFSPNELILDIFCEKKHSK